MYKRQDGNSFHAAAPVGLQMQDVVQHVFLVDFVSQDHDLEQIYFDSFLKIAQLEASDRIEEVVAELDQISDKYGFKIVASVSLDEAELPEALKSKVIVSL